MCLIYLLLILQLNQFDDLTCFGSFLLACSVEEWGYVASLGHGKSWQKCFLSSLTLSLGIFCSTSPEGQAECLWAPRVSVSYQALRAQLKFWSTGSTRHPHTAVWVLLHFPWAGFGTTRVQSLEERPEVLTAGCIAKQPLTCHEPLSCVSSQLKLQFLCLEHKGLQHKDSRTISPCSGGLSTNHLAVALFLPVQMFRLTSASMSFEYLLWESILPMEKRISS